jgi:hypothetical protein
MRWREFEIAHASAPASIGMAASRLPQNELQLASLDKLLVETELILHFLTIWRAADPACAVAM